MNLATKLKFSLLMVSTAAVAASFQNCSKVSFSPTNPDTNVTAFSPPDSPGLPSNPNAPGTAPTIKQFQPALAVRDISCLACHANIKANVVTDFGYGNPWYMNQSGTQPGYGQFHYNGVTWQSMAQVQGQIIVPQAIVPEVVVLAGVPKDATPPAMPMSILSYLMNPNVIDYNLGWTASFWSRPEPANLALTTFVSPPMGSPAVVEQGFVYIGAPTSSEILSLAPKTTSFPSIQVLGAASASVSGLTIVNGANGSFVTNSGEVTCAGEDVVINGTLLLKNLKIFAENKGCRLYVTGTVFIEGPITYLSTTISPDPTENLQISSSISIIMGVGIDGEVVNGANVHQSSTPLYTRLLGDIRNNMVFRSAPTASTYTQYANSILSEAAIVGTNLLTDASVTANLPSAKSAGGQTRAKFDYTHLLLNAPIIQSRYLGTVSGVIVAESAEFSLGEFSFAYDPVFQNVPVLPALPIDILCAVNASSGCNPAQL